MAKCRLRDAEFARCFGKTSLSCHHKKDLQFVEVFFEHWRFPCRSILFTDTHEGGSIDAIILTTLPVIMIIDIMAV